MKARSKKNKGDRFEKHLVEYWRKELDKDTHRTPASGSGTDKNDIIIPNKKIEVEAKNFSNSLPVKTGWAQLERQITGYNKGILAVRHPDYPEFEKTIIVMNLEDWTEMAKKSEGEVEIISELDYDTKWAIKGVISACQKLLRKISK